MSTPSLIHVCACVCVCVSGVMSDSILFGLGLCHNDTDKRCEGDMALIHLHVTACSFLLCGELFFLYGECYAITSMCICI